MPFFRKQRPEEGREPNSSDAPESSEERREHLKSDILNLRGEAEVMMSLIGKSAQAGWAYFLHHTEEPGSLHTPSKVATLVIRDLGLVEVNDVILPAPKVRIIKEEIFNLAKCSEKLTTDVSIGLDLRSNYVIDSVYQAMSHIKSPKTVPFWTRMPRITIEDELQFTDLTAKTTRVPQVTSTIGGGVKTVYPLGRYGNFEDQRAAVDIAIALLSEVKGLEPDRSGNLRLATQDD